MINRQNLKKKARANVKINYFRNVILIFIATLLITGTYQYKTKTYFTINNMQIKEIVNNYKNDLTLKIPSSKTNYETKYYAGVLSVFVNEISQSGSLAYGTLTALNRLLFRGKISDLVTVILGLLLSFFFFLFLKNIIVIGKNRYFLEQRIYPDTKFEKLFFPYKVKQTCHLAYILFLKYIYQFLWSLTIVGGFIKYYEYIMIPYILAENPTINKKDAFALSKQLTFKNKKNLFKLDLSLIGWWVLGILSFNLTNIFYFNVYKECLYAQIYMNLRKKNKNKVLVKKYLKDEYLVNNEDNVKTYPDSKYFLPLTKNRRWLTLNYNKKYSLSSYILLFFTFSIIGYLSELLIAFVEQGVFVNRGTLFGPWLPIYGAGGLLILIVLKKLRDKPFLLFLSAMVLCGVVEFSTSVYLEIVHHMKWWDYTGFFMNIDGRVCLEGLLIFGLGGCVFTYILAPLLDNLFAKMSKKGKYFLCAILLILFATDFIYSTIKPNEGYGITCQEAVLKVIS